jgi:hypothetical protein
MKTSDDDDVVFLGNVENRIRKFSEQNAANFFVNFLLRKRIAFDEMQRRLQRPHKFEAQTFACFLIIAK